MSSSMSTRPALSSGPPSGPLCRTCDTIDLTSIFGHRDSKPVYVFEPSPVLMKILGYEDSEISEASRPSKAVMWYPSKSNAACPFCYILRALYHQIRDSWSGSIPEMQNRLELRREPNRIRIESRRGHFPHGSIRRRVIETATDGGFAPAATEISPYARSNLNIDAVKQFLHDCETNYECCSRRTFLADQKSSTFDVLLIDVSKHCLVRATTRSRYLCLSYVWGKTQMSWTTSANVEARCSARGLPESLPTTIQDAITLVQLLGERYLWVDGLCIIQDDANHKHSQILGMGKVYGNALMTIVAPDGKDAEAGLPGLREGTRPLLELSTTINGVDLFWPSGELCRMVQDTVYERRGWTFQERTISRRCLFVSSQQAVFDCSLGPEYENATPPEAQSFGTLDFNPLSKFRPCMEQELWDLVGGSREQPSSWNDEFDDFTVMLIHYAQRDFTYSSDVLNAFAGIMDTFQERTGSKFVSGLPEQVIDLAILWYPQENDDGSIRAEKRRLADGQTPYPTYCWSGSKANLSNLAIVTTYHEPKEFDFFYTLRSEIDRYFVLDGDSFRPVERDEKIMYTGRAFGHDHPACLVPPPDIDVGELSGIVMPLLLFSAPCIGLDSVEWEVMDRTEARLRPRYCSAIVLYDLDHVRCGYLSDGLDYFEGMQDRGPAGDISLRFILLSRTTSFAAESLNPTRKGRDELGNGVGLCNSFIMLIEWKE